MLTFHTGTPPHTHTPPSPIMYAHMYTHSYEFRFPLSKPTWTHVALWVWGWDLKVDNVKGRWPPEPPHPSHTFGQRSAVRFPLFNKPLQAHLSSRGGCQSVLRDLSAWKMNRLSHEKAPSEATGHKGAERDCGCRHYRAAAPLSAYFSPNHKHINAYKMICFHSCQGLILALLSMLNF